MPGDAYDDLDAEGEVDEGMTLVSPGGLATLGIPPASSTNISSTGTNAGASNASAIGAGGVGKRYRAPQAKTFQCRGYGECRMVFSRSEHLARHIRKHTGERPFTCHCSKGFSRLDNLRQHAQTVHADKTEQNEAMMRELTNLHASMSGVMSGAANAAAALTNNSNSNSNATSAAAGSANTAAATSTPTATNTSTTKRAPPTAKRGRTSTGPAPAPAPVSTPSDLNTHGNAVKREQDDGEDLDLGYPDDAPMATAMERVMSTGMGTGAGIGTGTGTAIGTGAGTAMRARPRPGTSTGYEGHHGMDVDYTRQDAHAHAEAFRGGDSFRAQDPRDGFRRDSVPDSSAFRAHALDGPGPGAGASAFRRDSVPDSSFRGDLFRRNSDAHAAGHSFRAQGRDAGGNAGEARYAANGDERDPRHQQHSFLAAGREQFLASGGAGGGAAFGATGGYAATAHASAGAPPHSAGRGQSFRGHPYARRSPPQHTPSPPADGFASGIAAARDFPPGRSAFPLDDSFRPTTGGGSRPSTTGTGARLPPLAAVIPAAAFRPSSGHGLPAPASSGGSSILLPGSLTLSRPNTAGDWALDAWGARPGTAPSSYLAAASSSADDSPFSFDPPDQPTGFAAQPAAAAQFAFDGSNPRKRTFSGADGPYGAHPDDRHGGGGRYEYGSTSRPASRRLSVMELCNDDDARERPASSSFGVPVLRAGSAERERPTTTGGLVSRAAALVLGDRDQRERGLELRQPAGEHYLAGDAFAGAGAGGQQRSRPGSVRGRDAAAAGGAAPAGVRAGAGGGHSGVPAATGGAGGVFQAAGGGAAYRGAAAAAVPPAAYAPPAPDGGSVFRSVHGSASPPPARGVRGGARDGWGAGYGDAGRVWGAGGAGAGEYGAGAAGDGDDAEAGAGHRLSRSPPGHAAAGGTDAYRVGLPGIDAFRRVSAYGAGIPLHGDGLRI